MAKIVIVLPFTLIFATGGLELFDKYSELTPLALTVVDCPTVKTTPVWLKEIVPVVEELVAIGHTMLFDAGPEIPFVVT
jgi:hypothetical protein